MSETDRPSMLSAEQVSALQKEAEKYRSAQRQMIEALGVLWNAQLDLSISTGSTERIKRALERPVDFYDNCSCGGGGGGGSCW